MCIHAELKLQSVQPLECFERGGIGAWYICKCGEKFRTDLKPYVLQVSYGEVQEKP